MGDYDEGRGLVGPAPFAEDIYARVTVSSYVSLSLAKDDPQPQLVYLDTFHPDGSDLPTHFRVWSGSAVTSSMNIGNISRLTA